MIHRQRLGLAAILASMLGTAAILRAAEDSFQETQSRIHSFTLANGMTFIVLERHQAPVAAFLTYADVGSVQEVKGITGLAHIFEHMAFKGTPTLGGKDYAEERLALDRVDQAFFALPIRATTCSAIRKAFATFPRRKWSAWPNSI
jgi:predicted Zn-dependent peptidase